MGIRAGSEGQPRYGGRAKNGEDAVPRLRRRRSLGDCRRAMRRLRLASPGFSCRARHPGDRPRRLRRLLCHSRKRERPDLADRPVIIGGGTRGVVLACCYVARLYGVRSAMPMFKALTACPDAVVIRPDMPKYREVGRAVRTAMLQLTPLVEPLSIDEAFLDLGRRQKLQRECPAQLLAALARQVEAELGITVSIVLSEHTFLPNIVSDIDN